MLLRSSSTPVLGSLLSSFSETPNSRKYSSSETPNITTPEHSSSSIFSHNCSKISYNKYARAAQNLTKSLYSNSSPISPSVSEVLSGNSHVGGFRRAQSEGNLEALDGRASSSNIDDFSFSIPNNKLTRRAPRYSTLEAIPSFSFRKSSRNGEEEEEYSGEEEEEEDRDEQTMENEADSFADVENLCFQGDRTNYAERGNKHDSGFQKEWTMEMHLARGLGISDLNFVNIGGHMNGGGGEGCRPVAFGGDGGEGQGFTVEEHYKKMLEENPSNPLCLRNYAQFLHQTKKDLGSAEEYYGRAILADPSDGEVLCQYAKLVWEMYQDFDRARAYFERAVRAAGEDSHVQAAYACFLWETADEEEDDEDCGPSGGGGGAKQLPISTLVKEGIAA